MHAALVHVALVHGSSLLHVSEAAVERRGRLADTAAPPAGPTLFFLLPPSQRRGAERRRTLPERRLLAVEGRTAAGRYRRRPGEGTARIYDQEGAGHKAEGGTEGLKAEDE